MQRGPGAGWARAGARSRPSTQMIWALALLMWLACLLEMLKVRLKELEGSSERPWLSAYGWRR